MPNFNVPLVVVSSLILAALIVAILYTTSVPPKGCMDIRYISYASFHFVPVTKEKLISSPDREFEELNAFLAELYGKYSHENLEAGTPGRGIDYDYRIAFKPCRASKLAWAFFSLNKMLSIKNNVVKLSKTELERLLNEVNRWEVEMGRELVYETK